MTRWCRDVICYTVDGDGFYRIYRIIDVRSLDDRGAVSLGNEWKYRMDGETSGCDVRFGSPVCELRVIIPLMWYDREFYPLHEYLTVIGLKQDGGLRRQAENIPCRR